MMKCEKEIVGENFEKRKKQVRNNKKRGMLGVLPMCSPGVLLALYEN